MIFPKRKRSSNAIPPPLRKLKWLVGAAVLCAAATPAAAQTTVFKETFGSSTTRIPSVYVPTIAPTGVYEFANPAGGTPTAPRQSNAYQIINDGTYAVINPQNLLSGPGLAAGAWWDDGAPWWGDGGSAASPNCAATSPTNFCDKNYKDHTGDSGAVMVVNAGLVAGSDVYRRAVTLPAGATYTFRAWILPVSDGRNNLARYIDTMLQLRQAGSAMTSVKDVQNPVINNTNIKYNDGVPPSNPSVARENKSGAKWVAQEMKFTVPASCAGNTGNYVVAYISNNQTSSGNDYFLDDIEVVKEAAIDATAEVVACSTTLNPVITAGDDTAYTTTGTSVTTSVLGNDSVNPGVLTLLPASPIETAPANGTVTVNADGTITYTPNVGFSGTDTYVYKVCTVATSDYPDPVCTTATVTVHVLGIEANPNSATTPVSTPVTIPVLNNDSSSDSSAPPNPASVKITANPSHGTVTVNADGTIKYTPNEGYTGTDTFTYGVCTTATVNYPVPACTSAVVTVNVTAAATPVPTLGEWALLLMSLGLAGFAARGMRKSRLH